jgi:RNA polymerase sigma-70 factor (ECF subfamily)
MDIDKENYKLSAVYVTEKRTLDNEAQKLVNGFLEQVPEKYATILTLFYINDLSHEEICETLSLPIGTVKNRLFRAKDKLKQAMLSKFSEKEILELF